MKPICWIWLSFSAIFIVHAFHSFRIAASAMNEINPYKRPMDDNTTVKGFISVKGADIDAPINTFIEAFNKYIKDYNKSNRRQNTLAGCGYIAAALVSLVSFFLAKGWI